MVVKKPRVKPRNYVLGNSGILRWSKSASFSKKARYRFAKPGQKPPQKEAPKPKVIEKKIGGEKNGGTRQVQAKRFPKSYETQEAPRKLASRKKTFREQRRSLRASITPGTVLILVAGPFRGKHVVFLKQLGTGLLLVTGPFIVNGVPLRRINQRYVIATKTKIDLKGLKLADDLNDSYFRKPRTKKSKPAEGEIFEAKKQESYVTPERKQHQVDVDKQIIAAIKKREDKKLMFGYLKHDFKLSNNDYPHKMVF